jgi:hypothetical protein
MLTHTCNDDDDLSRMRCLACIDHDEWQHERRFGNDT